MSKDNSGFKVILIIVGIFFGIFFLNTLVKLFVFLGYNSFFFLDNLFGINPFNPIAMWGVWGLLIGSFVGVLIAIKKYRLRPVLLFYPFSLVMLLIVIMSFINSPSDYNGKYFPKNISENINTDSASSNSTAIPSTIPPSNANANENTNDWVVLLGTFRNLEGAKTYVKSLRDKGVNAKLYQSEAFEKLAKGFFIVCGGEQMTKMSATELVLSLKKNNLNAFAKYGGSYNNTFSSIGMSDGSNDVNSSHDDSTSENGNVNSSNALSSSEVAENKSNEINNNTPNQSAVIEEPVNEQIFTIVEQMPSFPGGNAVMTNWIKDKIESIGYPQMEKQAGISGTCYVTFVIGKEGNITDAKILRGVSGGQGYDKIALKVVKEMPKWEAGKQNGREVSVQYNLPIKFTINPSIK